MRLSIVDFASIVSNLEARLNIPCDVLTDSVVIFPSIITTGFHGALHMDAVVVTCVANSSSFAVVRLFFRELISLGVVLLSTLLMTELS